MSRYIETEKALNTLVDCVAGIIPIALAKHIIEHNSIADVQPVVRGEWVDSKDGTYYANCSVCEYQMDVHAERGYYNYCPHCGAKMV